MSTGDHDETKPPEDNSTVEGAPTATSSRAPLPRWLLVGVAALVVGALVLSLRPRRRGGTPAQQDSSRDWQHGGPPSGGDHAAAPTPAAQGDAAVAPTAQGDAATQPSSAAQAQRGWGDNVESYPAAGPSELALLAPLTVGGALNDAQIARVSRVQNGLVHVFVRKGTQVFHYAIALVDERVPSLRAGRYAIYVLGRSPPDPASFPYADAIARTLRDHPDVPPPAGLTQGSFAPAT